MLAAKSQQAFVSSPAQPDPKRHRLAGQKLVQPSHSLHVRLLNYVGHINARSQSLVHPERNYTMEVFAVLRKQFFRGPKPAAPNLLQQLLCFGLLRMQERNPYPPEDMKASNE